MLKKSTFLILSKQTNFGTFHLQKSFDVNKCLWVYSTHYLLEFFFYFPCLESNIYVHKTIFQPWTPPFRTEMRIHWKIDIGLSRFQTALMSHTRELLRRHTKRRDQWSFNSLDLGFPDLTSKTININ
jgi:hypothetical protein